MGNNPSSSSASPGGRVLFAALAAGVLSFVIYYLTCFPTITWWTNPVLSLAASTLGVTHPPGALLQTVLGWIVTRFAFGGSEAYLLNLFSGIMAAVTISLVVVMAVGLARRYGAAVESGSTYLLALIGAVAGALTLAFGQTFWLYATKFTPYMMTALLTAIMIWAMLRWWDKTERGPALGYLILIMFLFGLDVSVHRTNLLLAPGLIIWVLLRRPKAAISVRAWAGGVIGLMAGLSFHLLLIPIASTQPFLNSGDPSTLAGFWDYVTLKQFGGGFLLNLWPRKAPFWDSQIADYLTAFRLNFMSWSEAISIWVILPLLFGLMGLFRLWSKSWRLGAGMLVLFLTTSLGAVIYFNVPENFIRTMYRHYLPSFVIFAVWIGFGAGWLIPLGVNYLRRYRWIAFVPGLLILLMLPGGQLLANYSMRDSSTRYFADDYARNFLQPLPENSILFTYGDNDTHPLWFLQVVEGIRPDVTVLNVNLLNTPWYVKQVLTRETNLPLTLSDEEIADLGAKPWTDTLIAIPVTGQPADFQLDASVELPDSSYWQVSPTIADRFLLAQDQLLLKLLQENKWQRPIYFSSGGWGRIPAWITPCLRMEGLVFRLIPDSNSVDGTEIMTQNIVEKYSYRGYADTALSLDQTSFNISRNYIRCFMKGAEAAQRAGDEETLAAIRQKFHEVSPAKRLQSLPDNLVQAIDHFLGSGN